MDRFFETPSVIDVDDPKFIFPDSFGHVKDVLERVCDEFSQSDKTGIDRYEYNNIISIEGSRGSGKTSFLLSIMKAIKENKVGPLPDIFVMDPIIEPRFFTPNRSIARLLVSKCYSEFKELYGKCRDEDLKKTLIKEFSSVNSILLFNSLDKNKQDSGIDGDLDSLDKLSDIFGIKTLLSSLFGHFLRFINIATKHSYTSIAVFIDDLDLESSDAYSIISDLSKYLKIKNLIFFLAYDKKTMEFLIRDQIVKSLSDGQSLFPNYAETDEEIDERATRFLEKLVPGDCIVHMENSLAYSSLIMIMLCFLSNKLTISEEEINIKDERYKIFFDLLNNNNSLRHTNQQFNLIISWLNKHGIRIGDRIDLQTRISFINECLVPILPALFELTVVDSSRNISYEDPSMYVLYGKTRYNNLAAFYDEVRIIGDYFTFIEKIRHDNSDYFDKKSNISFSSFLSSNIENKPIEFLVLPTSRLYKSGVSRKLSTDENEEVSLISEASMNKFGDLSLDPLSFFSFLSIINNLPEDNHKARDVFAYFFKLFYPSTFSAYFSKNEDISLRAIAEFRKQKSGSAIVATINDLLNRLKRTRAKADLKALKECLSDGLRRKIFPASENAVKKTMADIEDALDTSSNDSGYRKKVLSIIESVKALII